MPVWFFEVASVAVSAVVSEVLWQAVCPTGLVLTVHFLVLAIGLVDLASIGLVSLALTVRVTGQVIVASSVSYRGGSYKEHLLVYLPYCPINQSGRIWNDKIVIDDSLKSFKYVDIFIIG